MPTDDTGAGPRDFPVTDWGQIRHIQNADGAGDSEAEAIARSLDRLAERYWTPVYHYVRALRRTTVEDAKDLTQQFFATLLSRGDLEKLDPERGSFRGFLKTALRNFVSNESRNRSRRLPRDGARLFSLDPSMGDASASDAGRDWREPGDDGASPAEAFDREWARLVVHESIASLEHVLASEGKRVYFEIFRDYCLAPEGLSPDASARGDAVRMLAGSPDAAPTYPELAGRYAVSESDVGNYLRYTRKKLRAVLRQRVADYLDPGVDPDDEIAFLLSR